MDYALTHGIYRDDDIDDEEPYCDECMSFGHAQGCPNG